VWSIPMSFKNVFIILLVASAIPLCAQQYNQNLQVCTLSIENEDNMKVNLSVELAKTEREQTYGLMNRDLLSYDAGMLFIFENETYRNFWMKNTKIPLTIAYIDSSGIIKELYDMKPLDISVTYPSKHPVRYALEANKGWFKKNKIHVGCKILFNNCK
jgi:hypothetical protein